MEKKLDPIGKSSLGLDENIGALLCYLVPILAGLIFFFTEKDSKFTKFHGVQSSILMGFVLVVDIILGWTIIIPILLGMAHFGLSIFLIIKVYGGEWIELPLIGKWSMDLAEKQL